MFSTPVNSGSKPAPNSSNAAIRPSCHTSPCVGSSVPAIICSRVDLPHPFGPMMPTVEPLSISKPTFCNAQNSLWRRKRPRVKDSLRRSPGRAYVRYCFDTSSTRSAKFMPLNVSEFVSKGVRAEREGANRREQKRRENGNAERQKQEERAKSL